MRFRETWTLGDLQTLVDAADSEHRDLDFKSAQALDLSDDRKREAAKDASAFANGEGGIIVYGVKEDGEGKYKIEDGFDPKGKVAKEWLQMVLDQHIRPPIEGLEVFRIETDRETRRFALLVQIPRGEVEPHQAPDHCYYIRRGDHNQPMTHQEVKDAFFRAHHPNLVLCVELQEISVAEHEGDQFSIAPRYRMTLKNVGRVVALDFRVCLRCATNVTFDFEGAYREYVDRKPDSLDRCIGSTAPLLVSFIPGIHVPPLRCFPGEEIEFSANNSYGPFPRASWGRGLDELRDSVIAWEIYADSAPKKCGEFRFGGIFPSNIRPERAPRVTKETWKGPGLWPDALCLK